MVVVQPMKEINGFTILSSLYSDMYLDIFKATSQDGRHVLLKVLRDVSQLPALESRFHRDFNLRNSLDLDSVLKVESIAYLHKKLVMVMEDAHALPLDSALNTNGFAMGELLTIAIGMALCIKDVHLSNIIHSDIKPANYMFNPDTKQLKLTNFGMAITPYNSYSIDHAITTEGTLAYISPEKTGRLKKNVDFRSDYYSLGVSLYQMFSGRLPFECSDAIAMVHSHIARIPEPPNMANDEIPLPVAQMLLSTLPAQAAPLLPTILKCWMMVLF